MVSGASVGIVMGTGAFDRFLNWAIYKLKDKDDSVLIVVMFVLMVYLGAFGGSDALIAIVPLGVMFAKKLRLDPICAIGVSTYATLLGFGTGPNKQATTQMLMGVQIYGTFGTMFISMNIFMILGLIMLLRYVKKIKRDPTKSLMWDDGWRPEATVVDTSSLKEEKLDMENSLRLLLIYLGQYVVLVGYPLITGDTSITFKLMISVSIVVAVLCGIIGQFSFDKIGNEFAKGLASMAFVAFVIGLAKVMSIVMTNGNILHTIVFVLTRPLIESSKIRCFNRYDGGYLCCKPVYTLCMHFLQIRYSCSDFAAYYRNIGYERRTCRSGFPVRRRFYKYGKPVLQVKGSPVGSCVTAGVPFPKWVKWVFPKVLAFMALSFVAMSILAESGWASHSLMFGSFLN